MALIGSATPSKPGEAPSTATNITVWPLRAQRVGRDPRARHASTPSSSSSARLPSATRAAVDRAGDALAGARIGSRSTGTVGTARSSRAARRSPRPADARCPARGSRPAAAASPRRSPPRRIDRRRAAACPRSACRSCRRRACRPAPAASSASAFRISTPSFGAAARADHDRHRRRQPERARAGDDQHRDGVDQRVRQPRLRPDRRPDDERDDRRPRPRPARTSRRRCRRAAGSARGSLRLADHADDLREQRVAADALAPPSRSVPVPLTVPPVTALAARLLDRDRLAGDHRLVDRARALDDDAVDRAPSRRAGRAAGRRRARARAARPPPSRRRRSAAPSSAPGRAAPGSPRSCGCARAARAPGRAAPA